MPSLKKCLICSKFFWDKTRNKTKKFCSLKCRKKWRREEERKNEKSGDIFRLLEKAQKIKPKGFVKPKDEHNNIWKKIETKI